MRGACCASGAAVSAEARAEFERALQAFRAQRVGGGAAAPEAGATAPRREVPTA